jgi:hypothetical protein
MLLKPGSSGATVKGIKRFIRFFKYRDLTYMIYAIEDPPFRDVAAWEYEQGEPVVYVNINLAKAKGIDIEEIIEHEIKEHYRFLELLRSEGRKLEDLRYVDFIRIKEIAHTFASSNDANQLNA